MRTPSWSTRPSPTQPHWPSPVGIRVAWWRAGWTVPRTHRWCSPSSPGSSPFVSRWWRGTPAFLWLSADKIYQRLWNLYSLEDLILNNQQNDSQLPAWGHQGGTHFSEQCMSGMGLCHTKSDWLDVSRMGPVSTADCPWGHNQFTFSSSSVLMEDLSGLLGTG